MKQKMKIGLSLCGGGALGVAHIGVLRAFEEADIRIDAMAGASAGAIISTMYGAGVPISEMIKVIEESSVFNIIRFSWATVGLSKLTFLRDIMKK